MRDWPKTRPVPRYRQAVFLDRDGTINVDTHYPHQIDQLEFLPGSLDGLRILSKLNVHIIVVSNQAGIALGMFKEHHLNAFNNELRSRIIKAGGRIDAFYYCPHYELKDLKPGQLPCSCSKPSSGMLYEASKDFKIDLEKSYFVGDKSSDIMAGKNVGCKTILVETGNAGKEEGYIYVKADYVAKNLFEAAGFIASSLEQLKIRKYNKAL